MADYTLEMTRMFDAPPDAVFDAWVSDAWGSWIGPRDIQGEIVELDATVGGRYRIVMHEPGGGKVAVGGVYRVVDRPRKLVFTWAWEQGGYENRETLVTLEFKPRGLGTAMTIRHEGFADSDRRDRHNNGWTGSFDKLEVHLTKGKYL